MFSIHSVDSDRELVFHSHTQEHFKVELRSEKLFASVDVWHSPETNDLNTFFQELAVFPNPWQGVKAWNSLEGEFSISATCAVLGQVTFTIKLCHLTRSSEDWQVEAELVTELGQIEKIAKGANVFFHTKS